MPDLTFISDTELSVDPNVFMIRLPFELSEDVGRMFWNNIKISPNTTDPIEETEWNIRDYDYTDPITLVTGLRYRALICIPFERQGSMRVEGVGEVLNKTTNADESINTGIADITYDTRVPVDIDQDIHDQFVVGQPWGSITHMNRAVKVVSATPHIATRTFRIEGSAFFGVEPHLYAWTLPNSIPATPLPRNLLTDAVTTTQSNTVLLDSAFQIQTVKAGAITIELESNSAGTIRLLGEDTNGVSINELLTFTNDAAGRTQTSALQYAETTPVIAGPSGFTGISARFAVSYTGGFVVPDTDTYARYWAIHVPTIPTEIRGTAQVYLIKGAMDTRDSDDISVAITAPP